MGNNNTKISIKFDRYLYFTNESVTGKIHLDTEDDDEVSDINLIHVIMKGIVQRKPKNQNNPLWNI